MIKKKGNTALHLASFKGNIDCVKLLIHYGADIFSKDKEGNIPLHKAAFKGSVDCGKIYYNPRIFFKKN